MPVIHPADKEFLDKITTVVNDNLEDEGFGVSELATLVSMSRSNLLRKVKKLTNLSVSQFIRQERLKVAMELLKSSSHNVTEISYKVGFSSTSYFIKCFHEFYGFSPGEAGKREWVEIEENPEILSAKRKVYLITTIIVFAILVVIVLITINPFSNNKNESEKSIAVLPFVNDSNDSTNVYFINGLMESILNNLQKIEDLRVISRTSVEKYRNNPQLISKIAKELDVNYFVEGSGQKIGDQIMLTVQLIDAKNDRHLWSEQYNRDTKDIFNLQMEIAKSIAEQVEVTITPEEVALIEKVPTTNLVAYDYFLKGLDLMFRPGFGNLDSAVQYFGKALELDNEFARAYASTAISYFFLDFFQAEKQYSDSINFYADKSLLYDPKLPQSLIAKAVYYINSGESEQALPYLEKALEYNPNSILVINILSDFYTNQIPNTKKYLEYALKGLRLEMPSGDSVTASYSYLHISNAFIQNGFTEEAEKYIEKSLEINPANLYSEYVKAFIVYAREKNLKKTRDMLIETYAKDTTRWDVLQELAKICYFMRDFELAYDYYKKFIKIKETQQLNVNWQEDAKIAVVLSKMGMKEESEKFIKQFKTTAEYDYSIYRHLNFCAYFSFMDEKEKAIEELRLFSQENDYSYWMPLFLEIDPLMDNIREHKDFKKILKDIENKFWKEHKITRISLERQGLI